MEREGAFLEITRQVSGRIHSTQAAPTPKASRKAPPGAPTSQGGPHCLPPPPVSWNLTLGRPALPPSAPWGHGCCSEPPGYQCSLHASPRVAFPEPCGSFVTQQSDLYPPALAGGAQRAGITPSTPHSPAPPVHNCTFCFLFTHGTQTALGFLLTSHHSHGFLLVDFAPSDPWAFNVCSRNSRLPDPSVLDLSVPAPENLL